MKIGDAAAHTGLPVKTVRYYADIGFIVPARNANGYRDYSEEDIERLSLVACARASGFSLDECRDILTIQDQDIYRTAEVQNRVRAYNRRIDRRLVDLRKLRGILASLLEAPSAADGCGRGRCSDNSKTKSTRTDQERR